MFNTFISLLAVFTVASSNPKYPTYQYCSDMYCNTLVNIPSLQDNLQTFYNDSSLELSAKLCYSDYQNYLLSDFTFNFKWSIYSYDNVNNEYDQVDYLYFEYTSPYVTYDNNTIDNFRFDIEIHVPANSNQCEVVIYNAGDDIYTYNYNLDFTNLNALDYDLYLNGQYLPTDIVEYIGMNGTYSDGFNAGYTEGYASGNNDGYASGFTDGQHDGYVSGYTEGSTQDETAVAIFSGIINIALIPINFFLACLNFEVFGINIGAFVTALLTVAIVVIITRVIVSGGNGGGDK